MPNRVVIVANRLPVSRATGSTWQRSPGGLVSAMEPILRERGVWVGWQGEPGRGSRSMKIGSLTMRPVALTRSQVEQFYHGFSNRTIWPLYHRAIKPAEIRREWWTAYNRVNRHYARATAKLARKGDLVWVHDYHLHLVPAMLRTMRPDLRIGFFLHIPFPPRELAAQLPWRTHLCAGLLGADVVGFQTAQSAQNFSRSTRECGRGGQRGGRRGCRSTIHPRTPSRANAP